MTMTFAQLQSRVRQQILGFTKDQEQYSFLTNPMGSTDTSFTVDLGTVNSLSSGLVEIDEELILVSAADQTSGVVTVLAGANGRGRESTAPDAHGSNALVISDPLFPKSSLKNAIIDSIQGVYPEVYVIKTAVFNKNAVVFEYGLPTEADEVLQVTYDTVGPTKMSPPAVRYRFNAHANTTRFPTGKSIQVLDNITPGREIKVTYSTAPGTPTSDSDDLATVTGFSSSDIDRFSDMLVYGAAARLLPAYESARLQQGAIESMERASLVPVESATKASQFYWGLYKARLLEERNRFQLLHEAVQFYKS